MAARLELARRILRLEQMVEAYQRLYDEDLTRIHLALSDCRKSLISLLSALTTDTYQDHKCSTQNRRG